MSPLAPVLGPLLLASLLLAVGCARSGAGGSDGAERGRAETVAFLRAQLAGHLDRARGCFEDAARRHPGEGGMVRYGFDIRPDGRVEHVEVEAFAQDDRRLASCVRSRLVALYFDPAPPDRSVRIERTFVYCDDEASGVCRLGPARPVASEGAQAGLLTRVNEALAGHDEALRACASRAGGGEAVFDVRLSLDADGRIMEGRLERAFPAQTPLRRCAVGPFLGVRVGGEAPASPVELRYVFRLSEQEPT